MSNSSVGMQALCEQSCLDQVIQLVLSAFRLELIFTWRYTQGEKSLGLLVLSDLADKYHTWHTDVEQLPCSSLGTKNKMLYTACVLL